MKRIGVLVLIYVVGMVSGAVYHSATTGAADRALLRLMVRSRKEMRNSTSVLLP
jgi:hypothetical protein